MCDSNSIYTHNKIKEFCIQDLCGSQEDSKTVFLQSGKRSITDMRLKKSNTTRHQINNDSIIDIP